MLRLGRHAPGLLAVLALLAPLAGCGGTQAPAAPPPPAAAPQPAKPAAAKPLQKVSLRLDFTVTGWDAGYFAAARQGMYRDAGLDVAIEEGNGTFTSIQAIANGTDTFGQTDGGTLIDAVSRGVAIEGVAELFKEAPDAIVVAADSGLQSVKDLKGRKIGEHAGNGTAALLDGVLAYNGMTAADVRLVNMDNNALIPAMLQHQVDGIATFAIGQGAVIESKGMKLRTLLYSANGLDLPGYAIATGKAYASAHPDLVKAFILATRQGWDWARQHPDDAVAAIRAEHPQVPADLLRRQFDLSLPFWSDPVGRRFNRQQYDQGQQALLKYKVISKAVPVDQLLTDEYVPG